MIELSTGDCREILPTLMENSIEAVVTDPPYELGFMGKAWDRTGVANDVAMWREVLRVLKPGAHLVAFSGTRTYHRMACSIEDAGFEIRDQIGWAYGSGFPKSKNLDGEWDGWGTALKPAWEPIVVARKPLSEKTVAANVLRWGTGAINIGACRVPSGPDHAAKCASVVGLSSNRNGDCYGEWAGERQDSFSPLGRWPANLIHDGSQGVLELFPESNAGAARPGKILDVATAKKEGWGNVGQGPNGARFGDSGSAARFFETCEWSEDEAKRLFYCAKASKTDRAGSSHPTVKPRALMRYLCRLVTPSGGTVLDPFAGSGSTLWAARDEGFRSVGIEMDEGYAAHILDRIGR